MTKQIFAILVCVLVSHALIADDATLMWSNGDSLSGSLIGTDSKVLTWQSPLFSDPLQINLSSLAQIKFPSKQGVKKVDKGFRILMKNGDVLFGDLKSIADDAFGFQSPRFGAFELARNEILTLQRSQNSGGVIYSGPRGLDGWQPAFRRSPDDNNGRPAMGMQRGALGGNIAAGKGEESKKASAWIEAPDGSLTTSRADAALFLPQNLPQKFELEVELYSKKMLSFVLAIGRDAKAGLRLESWIDVLVAANGTKFATLQEIRDREQTLHLHLFVDYAANQMSVYTPAGDKLGAVAVTGLRGGAEGITLRNGEWDLALRRLRISNWDGTEPRFTSGNDTRIQMADGKIHFGAIQELKSDPFAVRVVNKDVAIDLPVEEIACIVVTGNSDSKTNVRGATQVVWSDGGFVSGALASITEGRAMIAATYSKSLLQCDLTDAVRLGLTPSPNETSQSDRLFHAGGALQGSLVVEGEADHPIQWKPLGGLNASTLKNGGDARFVRSAGMTHFSDHPEMLLSFPDVVYLTNNDVLPCRVESCSDESVSLLLPFSDVKSFPRNFVRAVELSATGRIHQKGFGAEGWKSTGMKMTARKTIERMASEASKKSDENKESNAAVPTVAKQDTIEMKGNASVSHPSILTGDTIRFHLKWPIQSYATLTVSLFGSGSRTDEDSTHVSLSLMQATLQVLDRVPEQNQMFRGFVGQNIENIIRSPEGEADIQLVARDGSLLVSVNEKQVKTIKLNPAGVGSKGLAFNANVTLMGNVVINGRVQQANNAGIEISGFEIDNLSGASIRQFIEEEARQATLTVPRFRRDNPPSHVLIAANGDLLRGKLLAIREQDIQFESRLETLRLERDRVAAIVWLDPPKKDSGKKPAKPTMPKSVDSNGVPEVETEAVTIQQESVIGGLLSAFGLEPLPPELPENPQPNAADQNDAVAGPEKSPGKAASSREESTAEVAEDGFVMGDENDSSMQALLADGFSLTMTPVRLTNGQIQGTSKLLGDCTFPAATIRELYLGDPKNREHFAGYEHWISRNAQEPDWDVAASDGGNSASALMIGEVADDFELPLLDGSTFRLKDHADKIIVLDFWATWCGPCVAALPDYIAATSEFDSSKVIFVAVNQQEASDQIRGFLAERTLSPIVALDRSGAIGQQFQVSGIPHTVILGKGNVVEDVHVGYQQGGGESLQIAIQQLLDGTWKRPVLGLEPQPAAKDPDAI